ncbi:Lipase OS=Rhizopus oryzae PE=1 SV=1 [Rhizoctonia solani AG-1 IB]|uniref:Lipase n=1 Tax=Thanatephorus cucumeris (strain AG1-IB / isolate 7/3/14) TaxID=1108050 RepID=A0A0B7G0K8_THACB|nr:Lipase OS=Rhizopus oryzae PE=1 SV=1 [Rhizoctonia solani AG-1 IB]
MIFAFSVLTLTFSFGALAALPDATSVVDSVAKDAKLIEVGDAIPLDTMEINNYTPYGWFAATAYCPPKSRDSWQCNSCQADSIKDFQLYKYGGDGDKEQYWYVGWWPSHASVVVGRQGTDFSKLWPVVTDVTLVQLPTEQFPGCPDTTTVHVGFLESHKRSINSIFDAVKAVLAERDATKVLTVGHSLGAALATFDGLYVQQKLGNSVKVTIRTFGGPRVGNKDFADCVDATIPDFVRITNKRDPVPVIPPIISGYTHPSGEKHINLNGVWHSCKGQENLNKNCSVGEAWVNVPNWFEHDGPYAGGAMTRQDANC